MKKVNEKKLNSNDYTTIMSTEGTNKIYSIEYKQKRKITKFRDWYLLISEPLKTLALLLKDDNLKKTIFPYNFLREKPNNLFYKGNKPNFNYFLNQEKVIINERPFNVPLK